MEGKEKASTVTLEGVVGKEVANFIKTAAAIKDMVEQGYGVEFASTVKGYEDSYKQATGQEMTMVKTATSKMAKEKDPVFTKIAAAYDNESAEIAYDSMLKMASLIESFGYNAKEFEKMPMAEKLAAVKSEFELPLCKTALLAGRVEGLEQVVGADVADFIYKGASLEAECEQRMGKDFMAITSDIQFINGKTPEMTKTAASTARESHPIYKQVADAYGTNMADVVYSTMMKTAGLMEVVGSESVDALKKGFDMILGEAADMRVKLASTGYGKEEIETIVADWLR